MADARAALLLFAKTPLLGQVKTRLLTEYGGRETLAIYQKLLYKTVRTASLARRCEVCLWATPSLNHPVFERLAAEFGMSLRLQQGATLGERMLHACRQALRRYDQAIIIGCDCPALTAADIDLSVSSLDAGDDVVLGPAADGGYYLLGLRAVQPTLFTGINWGEATVLAETRARIRQAGLSCFELDEKQDLDRPADYRRLQYLLD